MSGIAMHAAAAAAVVAATAAAPMIDPAAAGALSARVHLQQPLLRLKLLTNVDREVGQGLSGQSRPHGELHHSCSSSYCQCRCRQGRCCGGGSRI